MTTTRTNKLEYLITFAYAPEGEVTHYCIFCGSLTGGSTDGPYVCGACANGVRPDGRQWTMADHRNAATRLRQWRFAAMAGNPDAHFEPIFTELIPFLGGLVNITFLEDMHL